MRLIDADAFLSDVRNCDFSGEEKLAITFVVNRQPKIDAEPVKHGEWVDVKFSEGVFKDNDDSNDIGLSITSAKCSLCQRYSDNLQQYSPKMPAYCSHCGAKMDLKDGESE